MGLFEKENSKAEQIKHYSELLEKTREQYDALKDVSGSPEAEAQRNQLFEQIKQIEITIEEIKEQGEQSKENDQDQGLDLLDD